MQLCKLGAVGLFSSFVFVAPIAQAGERAVKPIAFKAESRENALSRYLPRFTEQPGSPLNTALSLTLPAPRLTDGTSVHPESPVLEVVLSSDGERSTAALAKDCTLSAPIPTVAFTRDAVAAR